MSFVQESVKLKYNYKKGRSRSDGLTLNENMGFAGNTDEIALNMSLNAHGTIRKVH